MPVVPGWISDLLLFASLFLWRPQRRRASIAADAGPASTDPGEAPPVSAAQFTMLLCCPLIIVLIDIYNSASPWVSLGFLLLSITILLGSILFTFRQRRLALPHTRPE